jgi:hypothetical protein
VSSRNRLPPTYQVIWIRAAVFLRHFGHRACAPQKWRQLGQTRRSWRRSRLPRLNSKGVPFPESHSLFSPCRHPTLLSARCQGTIPFVTEVAARHRLGARCVARDAKKLFRVGCISIGSPDAPCEARAYSKYSTAFPLQLVHIAE